LASQNHYTYIVSPSDQGLRVDVFLQKHNPELTRSHIKRLIDSRRVTVNDLAPKAGLKLKEGFRIELHIPLPEPMKAVPEPIPLDILFEDEAILIVNKPPGLVVHPAAGNYSGTLVNGLLYHCRSLSKPGEVLRPGIVHRLDKNTSGVMVVAKNDRSHNHLAAQFKDHSITRRYLALVVGGMKESRGTISSLIGRHPRDRKKMSSNPVRGKEAITHWEVLKSYRFFTLLRVNLETGRTHQIRVHLAGMHRPVFGDPEYGGRKPSGTISRAAFGSCLRLIKRQALHAAILGFIHPFEEKYVEFSAPPPEDFTSVLEKIEEVSGEKEKFIFP